MGQQKHQKTGGDSPRPWHSPIISRRSQGLRVGLAELHGETEAVVDALAEKLDARLREWKPETAVEVRARVAEVIDAADHDVLDLTRAAEQEVLGLLDEPVTW